MSLKIVAKPHFEVNNMHQRTEDWLERNVNGIIGFLPKSDPDGNGTYTVYKIINYKGIVHLIKILE